MPARTPLQTIYDKLGDLARRIRALETTNQLGNSSITKGAAVVVDPGGVDRVTLGEMGGISPVTGASTYGLSIVDATGTAQFLADDNGIFAYSVNITQRDALSPAMVIKSAGSSYIAHLVRVIDAIGIEQTWIDASGVIGTLQPISVWGFLEAYPRVQVAPVGSTINFGSGAALTDVALSRYGPGVLALGASHSFRTGLDVTASRPSAAAVGEGAQFYDRTLHKPIWSDGTNWRDAMANIV